MVWGSTCRMHFLLTKRGGLNKKGSVLIFENKMGIKTEEKLWICVYEWFAGGKLTRDMFAILKRVDWQKSIKKYFNIWAYSII